MKLLTLTNPIAGENTYLLANDQAAIVIDPGSNGQAILKQLHALDKPLAAILLTHTHYDHIMSLELIRQAHRMPPVYVAEAEASWLYEPEKNLSGLMRHDDLPDIICQPAEEIFQYQEAYDLAGFTFRVVQTPGHSAGGVSFIFEKEELVITGDALFKGSIGRTDLPTGDFDQLINSITSQLFTLPNHYLVYPGHGPSTTISHEKLSNPFFR
ncbi:MBL fold metallo-hydrolase [Streptococcus ictaluri]|uniref:Metallo-beta-lactamase domain protein n=1 Tax=Streptococcus ictaluri 707-05 TaxID=764299 RepID=G5K0C0_9STRE|nr:MBL fold metallo-hydrolase [Streptococcus ictaluri]EHI70630.1 metallo-beta-lactamase domain protein [Streptococcus ictaluri 707-05]